MYNDFIRSFVERSKGGAPATESEIKKAESTFAGNTNKRGLALIRKFNHLGITFSGKNVLDIGCAYGGMSIEASRAGANVIGIDVVDYLIDFAKTNSKDDVQVDFRVLDATSPSLVQCIGPEWADIVIVNDVFEHIYDTTILLKHISQIAKKGALLYYVIPNGLCGKHVVSEGHLKKPLISLLDADCWHFILGEMRPRIFYRRWEYFEALFSFYGFSEYHEFTTYYKKNIKEAVQECALKASETLSCLPYTNRPISKFGASLHDILSDAVDSYVTEVGVDLSILDDHSLGLKYLADFWKGIRIKN